MSRRRGSTAAAARSDGRRAGERCSFKPQSKNAIRQTFESLPDCRLERLPQPRLFAYLRHARAAGNQASARRAQQILACHECQRIESFIGARAPHGDVEDIASSVLAAVGRTSFRGESFKEFLGWLFKIARNEVVNYYRRRTSRLDARSLDALCEAEPALEPTMADATGEVEVRLEVDDILNEMRPDHRLAVRLGALEDDLPPDQIAVSLGMSRENVYQVTSRFRRRLAHRLERGCGR
jgi:RNA polymerase sigma factor (sigma-70 family)